MVLKNKSKMSVFDVIHGNVGELRHRNRLFEENFQRLVELTVPCPERWSEFMLEFMGVYIY